MILLALVLAFLASAPAAQSMGVSPAVLTVGATADITYSNPDLAGTTVTVTVENGSLVNPKELEVDVVLDKHGDGSAAMVVPNWPGATFNAPGVKEIARMILGYIKEKQS